MNTNFNIGKPIMKKKETFSLIPDIDAEKTAF